MKKEKADLIIHNGTVLTVDQKDSIIENGAIAIIGDKIAAIGTTEAINAGFSAPAMIDAESGIIMPGLINTHTHLAMSIFRGVADDATLEDWLFKHIFPLENEFIDKDSVYLGSLLSCAEMILSGTTTFCDMYFFEKETGRAAEETGMRAIIGEGIATSGEKDIQTWDKKKKLTEELLETFKNSELISIAVEPHSPYACNEETLKKSKLFARKNGLLYVIHLAETKKEFSDFMKGKKMTPVRYLDKLGVLNENTLVAHSIWINADDIRILARRKVNISHCPQSNMKLGSGIAPVAKMLKKSINVSLGTDGSASNNTLDMLSEMKSAALLAKVANLDASALSARQALRMATINGAEALGKEKGIGSLEIGKKADMIILDLKQSHLTPIYDYYSHLVYCATGSDVRTSIINGKVMMQNRKIENIDMEKVMKEVNAISDKIKRYQLK